jgi:hypothetical protein
MSYLYHVCKVSTFCIIHSFITLARRRLFMLWFIVQKNMN